MPRLTRRAVLKSAGATAATAPLCACFATNPATGQRSFVGSMDTQAEIQYGAEAHPQVLQEFGGAYDNPRVQRYVNELGQEIVRHVERQNLKYTFTVLNTDLMNAFALPGGYIYITRGILVLSSDESELAGVIGHEIGHVAALHSAQRHGSQQVAGIGTILAGIGVGILTGSNQAAQSVMQVGQTVGGLVLAGYGRDQELEADELSIRYLSRAGIDPTGTADFLGKLRADSQLEAKIAGRNPNEVDQSHAMATHPRLIDRVQAAAAQAKSGMGSAARTNKQKYQDVIDGMLYGSDPKQGVVRGRRFIHPTLRFAFEVPQGFSIQNGSDAVVAAHPNGSGLKFMGSKVARNVRPEAFVSTQLRKNGVNARVESIRVNNMPAATGAFRAKARSGIVDTRLVSIRHPGGTMYSFLFVSPGQLTQRMQGDFQRTTYSFEQISSREANSVTGQTLRIVTVNRGDTVSGLAARMPFDSYKEDRFRVLNGLIGAEGLRSGERVKVVSA